MFQVTGRPQLSHPGGKLGVEKEDEIVTVMVEEITLPGEAS